MTLERITIVSPIANQEPEGHEAAMIAKAEAAAATPDRPDWLPAKFQSAEDLARAYAELEGKLGGPKEPEAAATETPKEVPKAPDEAQAAATKAGLDMAALRAEFAKDGKLSDASLQALSAAGFDQATVDGYIAGQQALMGQYDTSVMSAAPGGQARYAEMVEWAKTNLNASEIAAFNAAVGSGNLDQAKLAVMGLGAKFTADVGSEPNLSGGSQQIASSDVYESQAQVTADMKDPKYRTDPAFRAKVMTKLGRSTAV